MKNKFLHRERYIRIGGILLLASPFFNFTLTVAMSNGVLGRYGWRGVWMVAQNISAINWALYASSVVIGLIMMKGRRSSWVFVLVVLGIYIMRNSLTFSKDTRNGYLQPVLAMIINIGIFALVYIQEFHQQVYGLPPENPADAELPEPVASPVLAKPLAKPPVEPSFSLKPKPLVQPVMAPPPTPDPGPGISFRLPMYVDFQGLGTWAQLTSISESEIRMRGVSSSFPEGIDTKPVELKLPTGKTHFKVRARLAKRIGDEYVFSILNGRFRKAA